MSFSTGKVIASIALSLACSAAVRGGEVSYSVQTVAGSSVVGDGSAAVNAQLSDAQCLAVDRSGNVYIADPDNHRVRRVNPQGIIQTVAGQGYPGFSGDGGPASQARLNAPYGLATDAAGALYIADLGNNRVRKVTPDGVITTVAGTGQAASGGDGSKAPEAQLNGPRNVAVDSAGNLYISEFMGHRIRLVTADGMIWTLAGTGVAGTRGEEIAATLSELAYPAGLYLDFTGTLFIADSGNKRIRAVYNGVMRTLPVPGAELILPTGVASDAAGGLYIADGGSHRLYRRLFSGAVLPVAGAMTLESAREAISDGRGNLLIADGHRVRLLTAAGGTAIFAGDGSFGYRGDGAAATASVLNGPSGVAVDRDGNLFIADTRNHRIRKISSSGVISTFAGTGQPAASPEGLPPLSTALVAPGGLLADPSGGLWISESFGARVRRLTPAGSILTVAGNGTAGFGGDSRQAIGAQLQNPGQTALDAAGNLYIADTGNNRIRRVINGIISTFAGNGTGGFAGDGGQAVSAQLSQPRGIAFDSAGNLYIADTGNHRIRKVNPGGLITTVAGDGNIPLTLPRAVAVDSAQNLYIADTANHRIVKIAPGAAPAVIAGLGAAGFGGDGGDALAAQFSSPAALAPDLKGNLYVADLDNNLVRKLTPGASAISPAPLTQMSPARLLHKATLREGPVAPGQLLTIVAEGIGSATVVPGVVGAGGALDTLLAETQVLFDGRPAPLLELRLGQIDVQVPYSVAGQTSTHVEIFQSGALRVDTATAVTSVSPGIFTQAGGAGPARVTNEDGALNGAGNPADPGSVITVFATGEGQTFPAGIDGMRATLPYPQPLLPVGLAVGGRAAEVLSATAAPGTVGMLRVRARVPAVSAGGAIPLALSIGTFVSQEGVTVFVK